MLRSLMLTSPPVHVMPVGVALVIIAASAVSAEERCKMSWEVPAADTKYTQQLALDVGDMRGHQIRVYELHRIYPNDKPNCEGLKRVESWSYGYSDYIDRNGPYRGYMVTTLENGDKIFSEFTGTSQTVVAQDGSTRRSLQE